MPWMLYLKLFDVVSNDCCEYILQTMFDFELMMANYEI